MGDALDRWTAGRYEANARSESHASGKAGESNLPSLVYRLAALVLVLVLAYSVAAASFTVAEDFRHHCTGDGCAVCAQMAGCLHIARGGVTLAGVATLLAIFRVLAASPTMGDERGRFRLTTLVALGVQLND